MITVDAPGVSSIRDCVIFVDIFGQKTWEQSHTEFQKVRPIHIFWVIARMRCFDKMCGSHLGDVLFNSDVLHLDGNPYQIWTFSVAYLLSSRARVVRKGHGRRRGHAAWETGGIIATFRNRTRNTYANAYTECLAVCSPAGVEMIGWCVLNPSVRSWNWFFFKRRVPDYVIGSLSCFLYEIAYCSKDIILVRISFDMGSMWRQTISRQSQRPWMQMVRRYMFTQS
jgi:hypothetical protein